MIARFLAAWASSLLLCTIAAAAEKNSWTNEEVADDYLRRGLLTKDQHALLRSNEFLQGDCLSDKPSSCKPKINFVGGQCSITLSYNRDRPTRQNTAELLFNTRSVGIRVAQYPAALRAFGKWDAPAEKAWSELKEVHAQLLVIANSSSKRLEKLRQAEPLLEKASNISEAMASAAGFEYEGGCGAGAEDSQSVRFTFPEKPKAAVYILQMDFDTCKKVLVDPYDTSKCEAWTNIQQSNELSGYYRYRVTWSDGRVTEKPFGAMSKGKKTIEIAR